MDVKYSGNGCKIFRDFRSINSLSHCWCDSTWDKNSCVETNYQSFWVFLIIFNYFLNCHTKEHVMELTTWFSRNSRDAIFCSWRSIILVLKGAKFSWKINGRYLFIYFSWLCLCHWFTLNLLLILCYLFLQSIFHLLLILFCFLSISFLFHFFQLFFLTWYYRIICLIVHLCVFFRVFHSF